MKEDIPKKLYKYKSFGVNSLKMLSESVVYYSNPKHFNDPLDCKPIIRVDVERKAVENLCYQMLKEANDEESAKSVISNIHYLSTEYGDYRENREVEDYYIRMLANEILEKINSEMQAQGVLSLARHFNCPLMWSHYADYHKGICIEYDITKSVGKPPIPVNYDRPRGICVSDLIDWKLSNSVEAQEKIEGIYFYSKAPQWGYEEEWRYINKTQGVLQSPIELSGVYFGMRCDSSVVTSIVKLFDGDERDIKFYEVYADDDSFELMSRLLNTDEIKACGLRTSALLDFKDIVIK
jgi:hypothetical protein